VLLSHRLAALVLAAGLGFFALGTAADVAGATRAEQFLELCSGLCIGAGLVLLMYAHMQRNLRADLSAPVDDEVTVVDQRTERRVPAGAAP
jgi:hypothetical protein